MSSRDDDEFLFVDELPAHWPGDARIVQIPAGISIKMELLATLAGGLEFPGYFGWNWDALDECLRDLSWIESPRQIVLVHNDIPLQADSEDRAIYLAILRDAVQSWGPGQPHELIVVFPTCCRSEFAQ
jgi:RNAse (barnase) inhibitor barstar